MNMSKQVRDVFILSGLIALYGLALWLYESKLAQQWGENYSHEPRALFNKGERERLIEEEMTFTPPADAMTVAPLPEETTDGTD